MADLKISEMTYMSGSNMDTGSDWIPYVDTSDTGDPNKKINLYELKSNFMLPASTTINFSASMDAPTIQSYIDSIPKNLNGNIITFQFADGTYNLNNRLVFSGFYAGTVQILGNATNASRSLSKNVKLASTITSSASCMYFNVNNAIVIVRYLQLDYTNTTVGSSNVFELDTCTSVRFTWCSLKANDNTHYLLTGRESSVRSYQNIYGLGYAGIYSVFSANIISQDDADGGTGNKPTRGLVAYYGGVIAKADGTNVSGSVANSEVANGGEIRG